MTVQVRWPAVDMLAGEMVAAARDRGGLLLVTDFDGTVAPIVARPGEARPLAAAHAALRRLAGLAAAPVPVLVAVVTARDSDDVAARLPLGGSAVLVGSAGLERLDGDRIVYHPDVEPWLVPLAAATADLERGLAAGRCPGARLERRHCGSVLHTRGIRRPEADSEAMGLAREVALERGLRIVAGKRTVEVRVPVDRDKADAVADLRARPGWGSTALVAAGDDLPDLEMLALASSTPGGFGVAVADSETPGAVLDVASAAVEGPWAWAQVLGALAQRLAPA